MTGAEPRPAETPRTVELPDLAATARFGAIIAGCLQPGDVVALSGELGAGKTTLARAIIAALGHAGEVPSPSFAIIELYEPPLVRLAVVHADFYRLADPAELAEIGLDDYRADAALIAEWPELAGGFGDDPACLSITLVPGDSAARPGETVGDARRAIVEAGADWVMRGPWPAR